MDIYKNQTGITTQSFQIMPKLCKIKAKLIKSKQNQSNRNKINQFQINPSNPNKINPKSKEINQTRRKTIKIKEKQSKTKGLNQFIYQDKISKDIKLKNMGEYQQLSTNITTHEQI